MSERRQKPKEYNEGQFGLPDQRAIEAARAKRKEKQRAKDGVPHGTVVGLDRDTWSAAILDLSMPASRIEYYRVRWSSLGWIRLEGKPTVIGYDRGAEVWIKPVEDVAQAMRERRQKIEKLVSLGYMHSSALGGNVHVQSQLGPHMGAV